MSRKKRAFNFEGSVDLSQWDFNRLEEENYAAADVFRAAIEACIAEESHKLLQVFRRNDEHIKMVASEVFEIVLEEGIDIGFYQISGHPEKVTIEIPSLAEDEYVVEVDIRQAINECLLNCCDPKDGFVLPEHEKDILNFAAMLDELSIELKTAIRKRGSDEQ